MIQRYFYIMLAILCFGSCVQKAYEQKVTFILNVSDMENIKKVGIRGAEKPLSWNEDFILKETHKDSIYTVDVNFLTGYTYTEVKFTVNGEYELIDKANRKIYYDANHHTVYEAKFDKVK